MHAWYAPCRFVITMVINRGMEELRRPPAEARFQALVFAAALIRQRD